ncbi:putative extracellular serine carboxypeptidase [Psilocybe cubensis]|uniref:Peptidase S28 n=2 Tax=Psilocybe cubensis TaxID=181762 RepID=A0A8H7XQW7_PSICU|nr:putative extracellular serine carboxypeptidase [Psilocybe cubensis]KAH9480734.1 putative extracellular serine carboxypeptidase [Psilocybe cubensis]
MARKTIAVAAALFLTVSSGTHALSNNDQIRILGPQGVNLWKLDKHAQKVSNQKLDTAGVRQESDTAQKAFSDSKDSSLPQKFPAQWFRQPLDHFDSKSRAFFHQRYWVSTRHYKPRKGAPVIVLDGGETSGENRLPFLDTGIVEILTRATGGVGVILEHRYYGESVPVTNFSTDALRFLNNEQSAADSANFMKNIEFNGIDEDLTAPNTPWIYYGGSYAGARAAHMKILYPDIVWGAIASSGVTHASLENWQYMDLIREAADPKCSAHLVNSINTIDSILAGPAILKRQLKNLFGLGELEHDDDFASVLETPLGSWQAKCWDPAVGSTRFDEFCEALDAGVLSSTPGLSELPFGHPDRIVQLEDGLAVDLSVINYGKWIKKHIVSRCPEGFSVEECFGTYDDDKYKEDDIDQEWRLWLFQVCTQWGYFTTAPADQNTPRIVSKLLTLGYESKICKQAFPPGKHFSVPSMPNITAVNALGDFWIEADRLAIIDGEVDPWRPVTPHSDDAPKRNDTILRPFKLIPNAVHHYDEYGLANIFQEPPEIRKIHAEMISFVTSWLKDWNKEHGVQDD